MPWVTEQEQNDLVKRIEETRDWLDKKLEEQDKLGLTDDPSFSMEDFDKELGKMTKLAKKVFSKKKPKEKKPKKEEASKSEEEAKSDADQENTTSNSEQQSEETITKDEAAEEMGDASQATTEELWRERLNYGYDEWGEHDQR